jgi:hypothetical protein
MNLLFKPIQELRGVDGRVAYSEGRCILYGIVCLPVQVHAVMSSLTTV